MLVRHLPYVAAVTDDVLMLRDGEIMATFAVDGIGATTAESVLVGDVADVVQSVVAQSPPDLGFHLHRVSFSFEVDRHWQAAFAAMALRERRSFLIVVLRPQKILGLSTRLFGAGATVQRDHLARRVERLKRGRLLPDGDRWPSPAPGRLTVADGRWLGLLRTLVIGRFEPISLPQTFEPAMISSRNFAHFTALHAAPGGVDAARTPWGEAVTALQAVLSSAYRFNLHIDGKVGERTVGHTLVLGQTGSGKILGTAFLVTQAGRTGCPSARRRPCRGWRFGPS